MDASRARTHLLDLRAAGIGVRQIADSIGCSYSYIADLARTRRDGTPVIQRVRAETEQRILAVAIDPRLRAHGCRVDATGTRRRIQALVAIGYPLPTLAAMLAIKPSQLGYLLDRTSVTARTAAQVTALYDSLWDTPPACAVKDHSLSDRARELARQRWWLPPLAWDDIDNDPRPDHATLVRSRDDVDEIAVERAIAGDGVRLAQLTKAEQREVVHRLTRRGISVRDTANLLGTTARSISRRRAAMRAS